VHHEIRYRILTHLKEPDRSRSLYLSFCTTSIVASSFLRTIRSQITTVLLTFRTASDKVCIISSAPPARMYESMIVDWLTPCGLVYSASRYTNNCFVFQLKSGVKSGAARSDRKIRSRIRNRDCAIESGGSPVRLFRCHRDEKIRTGRKIKFNKTYFLVSEWIASRFGVEPKECQDKSLTWDTQQRQDSIAISLTNHLHLQRDDIQVTLGIRIEQEGGKSYSPEQNHNTRRPKGRYAIHSSVNAMHLVLRALENDETGLFRVKEQTSSCHSRQTSRLCKRGPDEHHDFHFRLFLVYRYTLKLELRVWTRQHAVTYNLLHARC